MSAYERLKTRFERIATVGEASSMLGWDAAAVMPPGGGAPRVATNSPSSPASPMAC